MEHVRCNLQLVLLPILISVRPDCSSPCTVDFEVVVGLGECAYDDDGMGGQQANSYVEEIRLNFGDSSSSSNFGLSGAHPYFEFIGLGPPDLSGQEWAQFRVEVSHTYSSCSDPADNYVVSIAGDSLERRSDCIASTC